MLFDTQIMIGYVTGLLFSPLDEFPKLHYMLEHALVHFQADARVADLIVGRVNYQFSSLAPHVRLWQVVG